MYIMAPLKKVAPIKMFAKLEDALSRLDMVQLLQDIGFQDVDAHSEQQLLYCVFHSDVATKSFSVNILEKKFHCFSSACAVQGNAVKLYALWKQLPLDQAIEEILYLPKRRDLDTIKQRLENKTGHIFSHTNRLKIVTKYIESMPLLSSTPLVENLVERGITIETMNYFGLRAFSKEIENSFDQDQLFQAGILNVWKTSIFTNHPIIFPFVLGKSVVYAQGRLAQSSTTLAKYKGLRGAISGMFNHNVLFNNPTEVYMTEGAMDCISLYELGYKNSLGVVGTEGFNSNWLEDFRGVKTVYIATDHDAAGEGAFISWTNMLQSKNIKVLRFEFDRKYKDINECLVDSRNSKNAGGI